MQDKQINTMSAQDPFRVGIALDSTGDVSFDGSGNMKMVETNADKLALDIYTYIKTVKGENLFDTSLGFDLFSAIEQPFSKATFESYLREAIEQYRNRPGRSDRLKSIDSIEVGDPDINGNIAVSIRLASVTNEIVTLEASYL